MVQVLSPNPSSSTTYPEENMLTELQLEEHGAAQLNLVGKVGPLWICYFGIFSLQAVLRNH